MKVVCLVVTYNPDPDKLLKLTVAIRESGADYVIVDNSDEYVWLPDDGFVIRLGANKGIAAAQNIGINHSLGVGAEVLVFLDQDSSLDAGVIEGLLEGISNGDAEIVAPIYKDYEKGFTYPIVNVLRSGLREKIIPYSGGRPFYTNVAISSGTAVQSHVFEKVGLMREDFFIDYVDTEWCLRCFAFGYRVKVLPSVCMRHSIGDRSINLYFLRVPVHSPYRRYYRVRNSIHLLRINHVPKLMAIREVVFSVLHQLLLILFGKDWRGYTRYLVKGIADGCTGKTGKVAI